MNRLDLGPLCELLRSELSSRCQRRRRPLRLGVLLEEGNQAGGSFARSLEKEAAGAGIEVSHTTVPAGDPERALVALDRMVVDPITSGVVVVQPVLSLPSSVVAAHLPASHDVEAVTAAARAAAAAGLRRGTPVAEACLAILTDLEVDLDRARILVVGHGATGGRPISERLLAAGAQVSVVQHDIAEVDPLPPYDVLITAVGVAGVIPPRVVREGATVLDVGTSMVEGTLRGDLSPEAAARAGRFTPVPGGVGRVTAISALLSLTELTGLQPGPVASWSLLELVARMLSPKDAAGGAAAAAVTGSLAAALDGLCRMHGPAEEISESALAAVRLLLAADRDRIAFGDYQRARKLGPEQLAEARRRALVVPGEIGAQLQVLEERLGALQTSEALDLDRRLAAAIAGAARQAVLELQREFSDQT